MCEFWGPRLRISGQIVACGLFPVLVSPHLGELHSHLRLSKIKSIDHVSKTMADNCRWVKTIVLVDPEWPGSSRSNYKANERWRPGLQMAW